MMQPAGGMAPPPSQMPPPPSQQPQGMAPQQQPPPQQWGMMAPPPQYHQQQQQPQAPPPMWNQQPSQIPPPVPQGVAPQPQQLQPQYPGQAPAGYGVAGQAAQPASADEIRTLWIGDLQAWMDENYVFQLFAATQQVQNVKLIRDKHTGQLQGYGFIEFHTRAAAEYILQTYNGQLMPNGDQTFRLNWATFGAGEKRDDTPDYTIFVGDLASDVTDYMLQETFRNHYPSVKGAKVVTDKLTGRSKGYGFVRFSDANEQNRAMTEMNGMFCSSRAMRIGPATNKKTVGTEQKEQDSKRPTSFRDQELVSAVRCISSLLGGPGSYQNSQTTQSESDPNNTTIFVGALDPNVSEDHLRQVFGSYGELVHVKIPLGKRCGFVQFANRTDAEQALQTLQGTQLGAQNVRLSWGRSPSNKQSQQDANQWNGNYYGGYGQGYEAYGYAQPQQDPSMYSYGAYPGYGNYQQQQ